MIDTSLRKARRRYNHSAKGRACAARYRKSKKGKAAQQRRLQSPQFAAYQKTYRRAHQDYANNQRIKRIVFSRYGGCCCKCGIADLRVLVLHHQNGDGGAHRRKLRTREGGYKFYRAIMRGKFTTCPPLIVLCANCHLKQHSRPYSASQS